MGAHRLALSRQGIGRRLLARDPDEVVVGYGANDRAKTTKVEVEKIMVRPEFLAEGLNGKADVALIKLKTPVDDPKTVPLADPEADKKYLVPGARVTVSGWGTLWSYDEDFASLMSELGPDREDKVKGPHQAPRGRARLDRQPLLQRAFAGIKPATTIADTEFCAFQKGMTKDTCQGDSGSPMVVRDESSNGFVQVGVVSWGRGCGGSMPGVYARVAPFAGWIADTIKSN
jgi:secreted trypsin-like serine protease